MFGIGPNGGGGNPFTDFLLGLVAQDNPSVVANAAANLGVPPPNPGGPPAFGNMFNPLPADGSFPEGQIAPIMGMPAPGAAPATGPMPQGGMNPMAALGILQGFKAPPPVAAPIFNAGVSGAQKAPEVQASAAGGTNMLQLLKLLQSSGGPAATPAKPLGSYF